MRSIIFFCVLLYCGTAWATTFGAWQDGQRRLDALEELKRVRALELEIAGLEAKTRALREKKDKRVLSVRAIERGRDRQFRAQIRLPDGGLIWVHTGMSAAGVSFVVIEREKVVVQDGGRLVTLPFE
ncbi:MAG: hypothetical protein IJU76_15230 [Desulfovibrionaceae bacterium]|nr:hypothetical protein [Desulfovibrionaceae bacterium]